MEGLVKGGKKGGKTGFKKGKKRVSKFQKMGGYRRGYEKVP